MRSKNKITYSELRFDARHVNGIKTRNNDYTPVPLYLPSLILSHTLTLYLSFSPLSFSFSPSLFISIFLSLFFLLSLSLSLFSLTGTHTHTHTHKHTHARIFLNVFHYQKITTFVVHKIQASALHIDSRPRLSLSLSLSLPPSLSLSLSRITSD